MSRAMPYFKCYPGDFLVGTQGMSREDFANYVRLIFLMYEQGKPIRFDPAWLRFPLGYYHAKDCEKKIRKLIDLGKIILTDGELHNGRTDYEMKRSRIDQAEISPGSQFSNGKKPNDPMRAHRRGQKQNQTSPNGDVTHARSRARSPPEDFSTFLQKELRLMVNGHELKTIDGDVRRLEAGNGLAEDVGADPARQAAHAKPD